MVNQVDMNRQRQLDLEISATIGKHQSDHLKENYQCYGMRHCHICGVQCVSTTLMFLVCLLSVKPRSYRRSFVCVIKAPLGDICKRFQGVF